LALNILRELVSKTNTYISSRGTKNLNAGVVERIARWVGSMLRVFGLGEGPGANDEIGWGKEIKEGEEGAGVDVSFSTSNSDIKEVLMKSWMTEGRSAHAVFESALVVP
jgi:hypothetical protein